MVMGLVKAQVAEMNGSIDERILKIRDELGDPAYAALQPVVTRRPGRAEPVPLRGLRRLLPRLQPRPPRGHACLRLVIDSPRW